MSDIDKENKRFLLSKGKAAVRIAECALFVVLMVVSAFIRIPFPPVPLTFQTVVAVLAGLMLGPGYGAAAVAVYVFMGLLGLPVFTNGGGFAYVLEPTFGYILGFVAAAFAAGLVRGRSVSLPPLIIAALAGFLVNYLIGVPYFMAIWHFYMNNGGLWGAVLTYNVLYIPKDAALCVLSAFLARTLFAATRRRA